MSTCFVCKNEVNSTEPIHKIQIGRVIEHNTTTAICSHVCHCCYVLSNHPVLLEIERFDSYLRILYLTDATKYSSQLLSSENLTV